MELVCNNLNVKPSLPNNSNLGATMTVGIDDSSSSSTSSFSSSSNSINSKPLIRNKMHVDTKPKVVERTSDSVKQNAIQDDQDIFCICRRKSSDEDDDMMIECDVCKDWLHFKCININQRISIDIETYVCPRCVTETRKIICKFKFGMIRCSCSTSSV